MWKRWLPEADSLLLRSLRGTGASRLSDSESPSFFEVLRPARTVPGARERVRRLDAGQVGSAEGVVPGGASDVCEARARGAGA